MMEKYTFTKQDSDATAYKWHTNKIYGTKYGVCQPNGQWVDGLYLHHTASQKGGPRKHVRDVSKAWALFVETEICPVAARGHYLC